MSLQTHKAFMVFVDRSGGNQWYLKPPLSAESHVRTGAEFRSHQCRDKTNSKFCSEFEAVHSTHRGKQSFTHRHNFNARHHKLKHAHVHKWKLGWFCLSYKDCFSIQCLPFEVFVLSWTSSLKRGHTYPQVKHWLILSFVELQSFSAIWRSPVVFDVTRLYLQQEGNRTGGNWNDMLWVFLRYLDILCCNPKWLMFGMTVNDLMLFQECLCFVLFLKFETGFPKANRRVMVQTWKPCTGWSKFPDEEGWSESVAAVSAELILISWHSDSRPTIVELFLDLKSTDVLCEAVTHNVKVKTHTLDKNTNFTSEDDTAALRKENTLPLRALMSASQTISGSTCDDQTRHSCPLLEESGQHWHLSAYRCTKREMCNCHTGFSYCTNTMSKNLDVAVIWWHQNGLWILKLNFSGASVALNFNRPKRIKRYKMKSLIFLHLITNTWTQLCSKYQEWTVSFTSLFT